MSAHHVSGAVLGMGRGRPCFPVRVPPHQPAQWRPPPRITSRKKAPLAKGKEVWSGTVVSSHCATASALEGEEMEAWPQYDLGGSSQGGAGRGSQASQAQCSELTY